MKTRARRVCADAGDKGEDASKQGVCRRGHSGGRQVRCTQCLVMHTQDATFNLIADDPFAVKTVDPHQNIALPYLPTLCIMCVTEDMCERDTSR